MKPAIACRFTSGNSAISLLTRCIRYRFMHLIAYTSRYAGTERNLQTDIQSILASSRSNNLQRSITGVMFQQSGRFIQFLEGPRESVESLMHVIAADQRHEQIEYLLDEKIDQRGFPDWNMDHLQLDPKTRLSPEVFVSVLESYRANYQMNSEMVVAMFKELVPVWADVN